MSKQSVDLVGMISPGLRPSDNRISSLNSKYFAYATNESVYVYDSKTISLINIIPEMQTSITTISFSQNNPEQLAIASIKMHNRIVNVKTGDTISQFPSEKIIVSICWAYNDTELFCFSKYFSEIFIFSSSTGEFMQKLSGPFQNMRLISLYNKDPPILIGGNRIGMITRLDVTHSFKAISYQGNGLCIAIELDPNNPSTCLVVWESEWAIFEISNELARVMECKKFDGQFGCAGWSPLIPGLFYTGDFTNGIIRIWNASSDKMIDSFTVSNVGLSLLLSLPKKRLLCGFIDGSIGIWDLENRQFIMKNVAGHTNTIFSVIFLPTTPDVLVSQGAEGSICTWNTNTITQIDRIVPPNSIGHIYSMAVSPGAGYIVCGYQNGSIGVFSLLSKNLLYVHNIIENQNDPISSLSFNKFKPSELLISSFTGFVCCFDVEKRTYLWRGDIHHTVRCAIFSPLVEGKFVYACTSGKIVIKQAGSETERVFRSKHNELKNPNFGIQWSPFKDDLFLTSNENGSVILWDIGPSLETSKSYLLGYHSNRSRAICFHPTLPNIAASGGYDGKIKIYDIDEKKQIMEFVAHTSHVYTLAFSPYNPNLLVSGSLDSSIKFWSLDRLFMKKIISHVLDSEYHWLKPLTGLNPLIKIAKRTTKQFMIDSPVQAEAKEQLSFSPGDVTHINDAIFLAEKTIKHNLSNSMKETRMIRRAIKSKERMLETAKLELMCGHIKEYCELMFSAGEFDKACAAAPGVSIEFWKAMMENRAKLIETPNEKANYSIVLNKLEEAVEILSDNDQITDAFLVAATIRDQNSSFKSVKNPKYYKLKTPNTNPAYKYLDFEFQNPILFDQYNLASVQAAAYLKKGEIYFAAAAFLGVGDALSAILLLLKYGQPIMAFSICQILKYHSFPVTRYFVMLAIQYYKNQDDSITFFSRLFNDFLDSEEKEKLAYAVPFNSQSDRNDFYQRVQLKSVEEFGQLAETSNSFNDKIKFLLLSSQTETAANLLVQEFIQSFEKAKSGPANFNEIFEAMEMVSIASDLESIPKTVSLSVEVISFYFGAYKAAEKGYTKTFEKLKSSFHCALQQTDLSSKCSQFVVDREKELESLQRIIAKLPEKKLYGPGNSLLNLSSQGKPHIGKIMEFPEERKLVPIGEHMMWVDCTFFPPNINPTLYFLS